MRCRSNLTLADRGSDRRKKVDARPRADDSDTGAAADADDCDDDADADADAVADADDDADDFVVKCGEVCEPFSVQVQVASSAVLWAEMWEEE